jgi:hypothetical protein
LFTDSVDPANYIGTVEGLSSITVKLPEEKFYTIVAVSQENWEERGAQAGQYSNLTYYSNQQPYTTSVRPDEMFGAGEWVIANLSSWWVAMRKVDGSGGNWVVVAPNTLRTAVPVQIGTNYDYVPHFYKELKFNGKVIALVESDDINQANTVTTSTQYPTFNTSIGNNLSPKSTNLNPAVFLTNNSDKTFRVYTGINNQISPDGTPNNDFAMGSGWDQMFTSGFSAGINTNQINFGALGIDRIYVSVSQIMAKDKVYRIVLSGNQTDGYQTTVTEQDADVYFGAE